MARSEDPQTFGVGSEPEISSDHLSALAAGHELAPEFVLEDVEIASASFAAVEAGSGRLATLSSGFRDCKLDYASFRFAVLDHVSFEDCVLTDTDLQAVRCESSRFRGCQLHGTDFSKAELDGVDLRGSDLRLSGGVEALRGAVVSTAQIIDLAIPLAEAAGIVVADD